MELSQCFSFLFKDVVSFTAYMASDCRIVMSNELGRMWKEAVGVQYEEVFQNFPGRLKEYLSPSWFHGRG
jgi:hypothetical protein